MANPTTNLNMTKPTVGGSTDTWGTTLNEQVIDVIDAVFAIGGTDVTMSDVTFNSVKFQETGSGTDFIAMQAPAAVTTSYTLTMPTAVGSSGQALRAADASGTLEWYTPGDVGDITSVVAGAGLTGGGTSGAVTLNAVGTSNRITVNADDIDIASTYVGQTSITTLGTITTGVWTGTAIANANLANSTVSYGGVSLALGASDATPAFNLSDATAYPGDSSLVTTGTITSGTWQGTALATAYIADNAVTLAKLEDGTQGDVLYYGASGAPARLGAGSSGQVLTSGGAGANPSWTTPTVGDVTAVTAGAGLTGGGSSGDVTLDVVGTSNRITVNANDVDIASTYVGQTSITTLGTIATGTWNGTAITGDYIDVTTSPLANTKIWIGDSSGDAQEFALSGDVTMTAGGAVTVADNAITLAKLEDGTQGDVLYYGASGAPARLGAGSNGQVLTSGGAGANPAWATPTTGDITSVVAGTGLSGGGTSGDVTLNVDASQTQITSVGALNAGSITSGFGAIDVGSSAISGGAGTLSSLSVGDGNITNVGDIALDSISSDGSAIGIGASGDTVTCEGAWIFNEAGADVNLRVEGDTEQNLLFVDAGNDHVGIGVATPHARLTVKDGQDISMDSSASGQFAITGNGYSAAIALDASNMNIYNNAGSIGIVFGTNETARMSISSGGTVNVVGELTAGTKTFRIDHPLPSMTDTHTLSHASIEGPQADLMYRGSIDLEEGAATIDLDEAARMTSGTWAVLCRNPQVWVQNETGWTQVRGSVSGSTLTISAQDNDCTDTVSWLVVAERNDSHYTDSKSTDDDGLFRLERNKAESEENGE